MAFMAYFKYKFLIATLGAGNVEMVMVILPLAYRIKMRPLLGRFVRASPTSSFLPGSLMFPDVLLRCWLFYLVYWHLQALLTAEKNPTESVRILWY